MDSKTGITYTALVGFFLGTASVANLLNVTHFVDFLNMHVPVGALPYPGLVLLLNLICEWYGKTKAQHVVFVGFFLNIWLFFMLWLLGILPATDTTATSDVFYQIRSLSMSALFASSVAAVTSYLLEITLYDFLRKKGKKNAMWLSMSVAICISLCLDTLLVIGITLYLSGMMHTFSNTHIEHIFFATACYKFMTGLLGIIPLYLVRELYERQGNKSKY